MQNGHANGGVATQQQGTSVTALADTDVYGGATPAAYDTSIAAAGDDMDYLEQSMARYGGSLRLSFVAVHHPCPYLLTSLASA